MFKYYPTKYTYSYTNCDEWNGIRKVCLKRFHQNAKILLSPFCYLSQSCFPLIRYFNITMLKITPFSVKELLWKGDKMFKMTWRKYNSKFQGNFWQKTSNRQKFIYKVCRKQIKELLELRKDLVLNGVSSSLQPTSTGHHNVPLLAPLLFLIYVNDRNSNIELFVMMLRV